MDGEAPAEFEGQDTGRLESGYVTGVKRWMVPTRRADDPSGHGRRIPCRFRADAP